MSLAVVLVGVGTDFVFCAVIVFVCALVVLVCVVAVLVFVVAFFLVCVEVGLLSCDEPIGFVCADKEKEITNVVIIKRIRCIHSV
jgi:hypothetical protein